MEEKSRAQELSVREISLIRELAQIRKEHKRELEYEKFDTFPAIALAATYLHDEMGVAEDEAVVVCPVDPYVDLEAEKRKAEIRDRIHKQTEQGQKSAKDYFRPAKPTPSIYDSDLKRVAVYARVSTSSEEQISSIENQTLYYTKKIAETENWNLQDIYSDEGKSGTSLRKRDAFKRMMRDAKDQKMDLIICASISRFARNFSDCMTQIAALKTMHPAHPIGVYFETENIYTLNPSSQYSLDIFVFCRGKIGSLLRLLRAPLNIPCPLRFQTGC